MQSCRHVPSQPVTAVIDLGHNQGYVNVYLYDQTQPFTDRRAAQQRYLEIFFSHARKDEYALWLDSKDRWSTITAQDADRSWDRQLLTADKVLRHANHRDTYALQSDGKTSFVVVDLDCHQKDDVDLFLRRAERLLERFHGDGWHYQLRDGTISGLHFIKVFDWPWRLDRARQWVQDQLQELDEPGLGLTRLETYPTMGGNGIRLPLAKNYLMILDEIVEPIAYRKQHVGDVQRYVDWLDDPNRKYFPRNRLLSFLRMNAPDRRPLSKAGSITLVCKKEQDDYQKPEGHGLGPMAGCFWSKLTDYWSGRWNPPGALDEAIAMTARVGYKMGYGEQELIAIIKNYCRSLPSEASSRLKNTKELNRCIIKQVRGVRDNKKQRNPEASDRILNEMVIKWKGKGIDLLNKTTWNYERSDDYSFQTFDHKLSSEDIQSGIAYLATSFPKHLRVVARQNIERIMLAMAKLAIIKEREENGISAEYWQAFFRDQFHLDLCIRNVWNVLKAAIDLGVIEKRCRYHRGRSTMYTAGSRMAAYFSIDGSILLVCKKEQELPANWEQILDEMIIPIENQLVST
jgi:hypothetical protein